MAILNLSNYTKCQFKSVLSMEDERNRCMEQRFSLYIRYIYILWWYNDDVNDVYVWCDIIEEILFWKTTKPLVFCDCQPFKTLHCKAVLALILGDFTTLAAVALRQGESKESADIYYTLLYVYIYTWYEYAYIYIYVVCVGYGLCRLYVFHNMYIYIFIYTCMVR